MVKRKNNSFTLVEIMVVVAIIAVIAAVSIPNFLRVKVNANEVAAINSLKTISTAMESFRFTRNPPSYLGASLNVLSRSNPPYIDQTLGSSLKQGYWFFLIVFDANRYYCMAFPQGFRQTGNRWFIYTNFDLGVIRSGAIYAWSIDGGGWQPIQ